MVSGKTYSCLPHREQAGLTEVSSQSGNEITADRYRGHAQLRVSTPDLELSRRWRIAGGGVTDLVLSERSVTTDRTRSLQFFSGEQPVGEPHSARGVETERSTHYSVVPAAALDLWHDANNDGRAVGIRLTGGYNATDERLALTCGILGRF